MIFSACQSQIYLSCILWIRKYYGVNKSIIRKTYASFSWVSQQVLGGVKTTGSWLAYLSSMVHCSSSITTVSFFYRHVKFYSVRKQFSYLFSEKQTENNYFLESVFKMSWTSFRQNFKHACFRAFFPLRTSSNVKRFIGVARSCAYFISDTKCKLHVPFVIHAHLG